MTDEEIAEDSQNVAQLILVCRELKAKLTRHGAQPENWDSAIATLERHAALLARLARAEEDGKRLDWWFANGLEESVCEGSVDLWWADGVAEMERVTHGTSVRDALDKAMRGLYEPDEEG